MPFDVTVSDGERKNEPVSCNEEDTVGLLKRKVAAKFNLNETKFRLGKRHIKFNDEKTLKHYSIEKGYVIEIFPEN